MALQPRKRRDTPAQDTQYKLGRARQQRTDNKDYSALQSAGMYFDDRDAETSAIGNVISNTTRPTPPPTGNTGSPTLRNAGRAGAEAAGDWRASALAADQTGPQSGDLRPSSTLASLLTSQAGTSGAPTPVGGNPYGGPTPAPVGPSRASSPSATATGRTLPPIGRDGWKPSEGIDFYAPVGGRSAGPDGRGTNTPGAPGAPGAPGSRPTAALDPTALGMARGVGGGQGYAIGPDGRTQFYEGTQRTDGQFANLSVMGNMGAAADEFARANAIRQEYIDSQRPQNQVTVLGNTSGTGGGQSGGVDQQIQRLIRQAGSTRDPWARAAVNRQISQLQDMASRGVTQSEGAADRQNDLALQQMRNQGSLAAVQAGQTGDTVNPYDVARAQQVMMETQRDSNPLATDYPAIDEDMVNGILSLPESLRGPMLQRMAQQQDSQFAQASLNEFLTTNGMSLPDAVESWEAGDIPADSELGQRLQRVYPRTTEDFAMGGYVPEFSALGFAQGGMVPDQYAQSMGPGMDAGSAIGMGTPGFQGIDLMQQEYAQYAQGAQSLGVPAVPFEEFVGLKQQAIPKAPQGPGAQQPMTGAMQSAIKMASGGMVPGGDRSDSSGKMIVDPNPDAPQDSIPAVIDGNRPAKLDSGEFVMPRSAVLWHGLDKLNKLIAQAEEKGQGNGTNSGAASAGQSATGSAQQ